MIQITLGEINLSDLFFNTHNCALDTAYAEAQASLEAGEFEQALRKDAADFAAMLGEADDADLIEFLVRNYKERL